MDNLRAFVADVMRDWVGRMSGGAGLVLTTASIFAPTAYGPRMFAATGVACLLIASYRAWLNERLQNEVLRAEALPALEFFRVGGQKPFFEEVVREGDATWRYLRIGLRNIGNDSIPDARVLLEGCTPDSSPVVHLEHELQIMGHAGDTSLILPPKGEAIFDVAFEVIPVGTALGDIHLIYAKVAERALPRQLEPYTLVLRAEGRGGPTRCTLRLGGGLPRRLELIPVVVPDLMDVGDIGNRSSNTTG